MSINKEKISCAIDNIFSTINCDKISFEDLQSHMEDYMTKQEIEKKYGTQIQQMPNGLWWIRLNNGKVIKLTKRENIIKKLIEIEKGNSLNKYTLNSFWDMFYKHRRLSVADGTSGKNLQYFTTYIQPTTLSNIPLAEIKLNHLEQWVDEAFEIRKKENKVKFKEKHFGNIVSTISLMFEYAIELKIINTNIVSNLIIHQDNFTPKIIHKNTDRYFLEDEEKKVLDLAFLDAEENKTSLPLAIPLLFYTGIRDGELCALHWRDISNNMLHIQSEMVEVRNEAGKFIGYKWVGHCKTLAGNRYIPLNEDVINLFNQIKKYNLLNGLGITQDDFIFQRIYKKNITFCTTRCFESRLKKYCKKANMKELKSQHDIRRTFATNLHYLGMDTKDLQVIMGHESLEQTEAYIQHKENKNAENYISMLTKKNRNKSEHNILNKKIGNA